MYVFLYTYVSMPPPSIVPSHYFLSNFCLEGKIGPDDFGRVKAVNFCYATIYLALMYEVLFPRRIIMAVVQSTEGNRTELVMA